MYVPIFHSSWDIASPDIGRKLPILNYPQFSRPIWRSRWGRAHWDLHQKARVRGLLYCVISVIYVETIPACDTRSCRYTDGPRDTTTAHIAIIALRGKSCSLPNATVHQLAYFTRGGSSYAWPTLTARVIPMIPTYTTPVVLSKIYLAFDWPTQMKIPRTAPGFQLTTAQQLSFNVTLLITGTVWQTDCRV